MTRMIISFDPSKAQPAIAELSAGLGPGIEWRVLNLDQNPNGVDPARPAAGDGDPSAEESENLLQRLTGWLSKAGEQTEHHERKPIDLPAPTDSPLELSEEELTYLRHAPARAATVILITAPESQASTVRTWSVRYGGFLLGPVETPGSQG